MKDIHIGLDVGTSVFKFAGKNPNDQAPDLIRIPDNVSSFLKSSEQRKADGNVLVKEHKSIPLIIKPSGAIFTKPILAKMGVINFNRNTIEVTMGAAFAAKNSDSPSNQKNVNS